MLLSEIAAFLGGELSGGESTEITGAAGLEDARPGQISFAADKKHLAQASQSGASCVIVKGFSPEIKTAQLKVSDPQFAFVRLLEIFYVKPYSPGGLSSLAVVEKGAALGEDLTVMPFAYISKEASIGKRTYIGPCVFIGENVRIGEGCVLYPNVVVRENVVLGDRVIVHSGTIIGSDGFGYMRRKGRHHKVPQVGGVAIGDDVEIGANVTIDRATTGTTRIGRGTKIDNLVQIAHNVNIGEDSIIVALTGIGGSSRIGSSAIIGGQVGIADHVAIEDGAMVASQSGIMRDVPAGQVFSGTPAIPHRDWLRSVSLFAKLPELNKKILELEEKIKELERRQGNAGD